MTEHRFYPQATGELKTAHGEDPFDALHNLIEATPPGEAFKLIDEDIVWEPHENAPPELCITYQVELRFSVAISEKPKAETT